MTVNAGMNAGPGSGPGVRPGHEAVRDDAGLTAGLVWRTEDGTRLPALLWRAGGGWRMISSALVGGGIGPAGWVLNAQVPGGYARLDPVDHLGELASSFGLAGPGVGMLTAAAVEHWRHRSDEGVSAAVTVGLRVPTWAAWPDGAADLELAPERLDRDHRDHRDHRARQDGETGGVGADSADGGDGGDGRWRPGTINIVVAVPVALTDAALVNAVATATEAKTQALWEAGYPCTGTASDAVCVAARTGRDDGPAEPFAGPRSIWGARIARAVHAAVHAGAADYTGRMLGRPPMAALWEGREGHGFARPGASSGPRPVEPLIPRPASPGPASPGPVGTGSGFAGHPDDDLGDPPGGLVG